MDRIFEQMTSWLKDWIVDGLMSLLTGTFDSINQCPGWKCSCRCSNKPGGFHAGCFQPDEDGVQQCNYADCRHDSDIHCML